MTLTIAALASGTGSNVAAMLRCIENGSLDARIALVLANTTTAPVLRIAEKAGVPVWARDHRQAPSREEFDADLLDAIRASGADTVVLAGYMRMLSAPFVRAFAGRILNIHPSLLPSFPGVTGIKDALGRGVRFTGVTVHFVDEEMDHGPIIIQAVVPIAADDTADSLASRIHALEHRVYPQALQWLAEDRLRIEGCTVRLLPGQGPAVHASSDGTSPTPWMVYPPLEGEFAGVASSGNSHKSR